VFKKLSPDATVESVVAADGNSEIVENYPYRNDVTGGWRLRLRIKRIDDKKPVELRAFLRAGNTTLTATGSYIVPPE
jgi:glucans biosynthesis protein